MMRRFQISLHERTFAALREMALEQRRPLRDQAAWLIEQQLLNGSGANPDCKAPDRELCNAGH